LASLSASKELSLGAIFAAAVAIIVAQIGVDFWHSTHDMAALKQEVIDLQSRVNYDQDFFNKRFDTDEANVAQRLDKIDQNQADARQAILDQTRSIDVLTNKLGNLPGWQRR
jgi:hypothetical protein